MIRQRLLPLLLLIVCGTAAPSRADIDLNGSWTINFGIAGIVTVDIVQSGSTISFLSFTGTIDPTTGVIDMTSPPNPGGVLPGDFVYGPSPPGSLNAIAAADGNSFSGNYLVWVFKITPPVDFEHFPWFGFREPVSATRQSLTDCGDGQRTDDEACDEGAANGTDQCCSATCTLVDGDQDGICDAEDECPGDFNPGCASLQLDLARVSGRGRARITGTLSPRFTTLSQLGASLIGGVSTPQTLTTCSGGALKIRCLTADRSVQIRLRRPDPTGPWRFVLKLRHIDGTTAPLAVWVNDVDNGLIASDSLENCTPKGARLRCEP